ncbi:transposase, partial [Actinoplanes sp. NPDC051346]|uniref:transposase n=1 Tax=Actinoplanes sp. NPDC051346 TaxID=3155048 RepID=UPI003430924F
VGSDLTFFATPDRLAAFSGLAPAPHDSGKRSGNLHRPRHDHRGLQRVFYMSALMSVRYDPNSRAFYDRKRAEGKRHTQAAIALARRRVNVLWALIRDQRLYEVTPSLVMASP